MVTIEPEPAEAEDVFGSRIGLARAFAGALGREGEERGLIGPLEAERLWNRHILNCAVIAPLMGPTVADVGSGAGLPGLVLAIARPDIRVTLIEPMERRVAWLQEQREALNLDNVDVVRARGEDVDAMASFDTVTARAVGALRKLIPWTAPLARPGGELVLMKGAAAEREIAAAAKAIRRWRLSDVEVVDVGVDVIAEPTRVVRARVGTARS